ncbi:MAG: ParB/RepB/Spo0J family partition protein [Ignavibacteriaceae bacterium]|nr:ParB/RepB/Spo0J family partition protein [Ignavibacteriaceae bacterium]
MSKTKQPALGRGLDALMNPQNYPHDNSESLSYDDLKKDDGLQYDILVKIPVEVISPNPFQPRVNFDSSAMEELKKSILENGLIQPITVRRADNNRYELISGERRLRACIDIGYREIPAYIIKVDSEESMLAMALIENIQREKLNPVEIGMAYKRLMEECHLTQEQIADKVGKDRTTVANSIRLLKLPKEILDSLIKEQITPGHARALINIPNESLQLEALKKIHDDGLSVRKVEQLVKKFLTDGKSPKRSVSFSSKSTRAAASISDVEDKLRKIFGTKVICRQKQNGTGEIVIEFYSNDELERLFELFEIIDKTYH